MYGAVDPKPPTDGWELDDGGAHGKKLPPKPGGGIKGQSKIKPSSNDNGEVKELREEVTRIKRLIRY